MFARRVAVDFYISKQKLPFFLGLGKRVYPAELHKIQLVVTHKNPCIYIRTVVKELPNVFISKQIRCTYPSPKLVDHFILVSFR